MALNLTSPFFLSPSCTSHRNKNTILLLLRNNLEPSSSTTFWNPSSSSAISAVTRASTSGGTQNGVVEEGGDDSAVLDDDVVNRAASLKDASEVVQLIADCCSNNGGGVVSCEDCCRIISSALLCNNSDLALSIFIAMRSSAFDQVLNENGGFVARWKWSRPDLNTYKTLVIGLAASLRVSDALKMVAEICRVGLSSGDEVPFGKVIRCPTCMVAVAVAQPQQGTQLVSCAKCRYQYELVSGDIVNIVSEEISMDVPAWRRWLGFFQTAKQAIPSAVHSIVIQTPSGAARTHRFATSTPDVPAQQGERVTISLAAPSSVFKGFGFIRISPKAPKYYPSEPLCLTNHQDGRESLLLRAPSANSKPLLNPSIALPLLVLLASGDAASGLIDPNLPQLLPAAAAASIAVGATLNTVVLPQLGQLPQRMADAIAIKQQLLAQYDMLQCRIKDLKDAVENEVWTLARICQLENKIFAVGEPSYRARRTRLKRVREGLENSLRGRIELIDSYARISSMIEIEVELDTNVLAAEAYSNTENIAKQIEQIMELENLEERWRQQVEANDELERLLSSESLSSEQV